MNPFSYVLAVIQGFIAKFKGDVQSVETILGTFHTTIQKLEAAAETHVVNILNHDAAIKAALDAKAFAQQEIADAQAAVQGIKTLLGK